MLIDNFRAGMSFQIKRRYKGKLHKYWYADIRGLQVVYQKLM
jgi:hypothetical protein